jgi:hypothetical protein
MKDIVVTGCGDCPYLITDIEYWCGLKSFLDANGHSPVIENDAINGSTVTPDWCPLNSGSVTIKKEK